MPMASAPGHDAVRLGGVETEKRGSDDGIMAQDEVCGLGLKWTLIQHGGGSRCA